MDTNYKLADHEPLHYNLLENVKWQEPFGFFDSNETRRYVGPKGWLISRNGEDKLWRLSHESYSELTLTMLDIDDLPVGRHNWRINNNVCNQGITNIESLLISACKEEEFTCDDGKCLNITKRCDNIEVGCISLIMHKSVIACFRTVMI